MDELRSTPFSARLRRLLETTLQPGERVLWQGQPDGIAHMMIWRFLWWIGFPWLVLTVVFRGWLGGAVPPLLLVGAMLMWLFDLQTLFAITNRRALILRTAWGKQAARGTAFADMDATFEIMDIGRGAGI